MLQNSAKNWQELSKVGKNWQKLARVTKSCQKALKTLKTLKSTDEGWVTFGRRTTRCVYGVQVKTGKMKTGGMKTGKMKTGGGTLGKLVKHWETDKGKHWETLSLYTVKNR